MLPIPSSSAYGNRSGFWPKILYKNSYHLNCLSQVLRVIFWVWSWVPVWESSKLGSQVGRLSLGWLDWVWDRDDRLIMSEGLVDSRTHHNIAFSFHWFFLFYQLQIVHFCKQGNYPYRNHPILRDEECSSSIQHLLDHRPTACHIHKCFACNFPRDSLN